MTEPGIVYRIARWLVSLVGLIPVREAAKDAEIEQQLRMVAASREERAGLLEAAVIVGQCGIKPGDLATVIGRGMTAHYRLIRELEHTKHMTPERIDRRIQEIWDEA